MPGGGRVEKHPRGKTKIIRAVLPEILAVAEAAVEQVRPEIHRRSGALAASLRVEEKPWGARVHLGNPANPAQVGVYEFGVRGDGPYGGGQRPLLHIRQRIARS